MSEIRNLQPQAIWENFYLLTQVPRPSGRLQKIQQFLRGWGKQKGIDAHLDNAGDVRMYKAASPGRGDCKVVTLQGHLSRAPQKTADSPRNFETDPLETYIVG